MPASMLACLLLAINELPVAATNGSGHASHPSHAAKVGRQLDFDVHAMSFVLCVYSIKLNLIVKHFLDGCRGASS